MDIEEIRDKITPILRCHNVKRAALFGSFVREEAKEGSDLDILIEFEGKKSLLDLAGLKIELEETLKMEVDVVEYSTLPSLLKDRILKEQAPIL